MLPLVIAILQVVNSTTKEVATILKWIFIPIPVFATCLGFFNIVLRKFLTFFYLTDGTIKIDDIYAPNDRFTNDNVSDGLKPFDTLISRYELIFLIAAIFFYWILLALIEGRILSFCLRIVTSGSSERNN